MRHGIRIAMIAVVAAALVAVAVSAVATTSCADTGDAATSDTGTISWILVCSALVFIMAPALGLFYGGMMRKQSFTSLMTQTLLAVGIMGLVWFIVGHSLAFSGDDAIIGNLDHMFFEGLSSNAASGISDLEFAIFQMMFAMITAIVMIGAPAERIRGVAMLWFLVFWAMFVYAPMAHWVWGGGLFDQYLTVLDFAGGTVVHICAGISGIALVVFAGSRSETVKKAGPHNVPLTYLGGMLVWLGWLGFNGGSGLAADGSTVHVIATTMLSSMTAMMAWATVQYLVVGRIGSLGLLAGAIAGLVAITPGAAYVTLPASVVLGAVGGVLCFFSVRFFRNKSGLDDAVDVFALHGVGGIWGALSVGIFADPDLTGGVTGLVCGGLDGLDLMAGQIVAVIATLVFCFSVSYAIIWCLSKVIRVRVTPEEEMIGQDIAEDGEPAYLW